MDHFVRVEKLPEGASFPPDLLDRVSYDPGRRTLSFRGFMSKADFDRLSRVSEDWSYRRSLEELFRLCSIDSQSPPNHRLATVFNRLIPGRNRVAH